MKRKYADMRGWQRILASRFASMTLDDDDGASADCEPSLVALYWIDAISKPLWVTCAGRSLCVADAGYSWLSYYPAAFLGELATDAQPATHRVTTMFDAAGQIVQWYVDICGAQGRDTNGVPWYDDWYLDVIRDPTGGVEIIDADELDDALDHHKLTARHYHAAWREAHRLAPLVAQGKLVGIEQAAGWRERLLDEPTLRKIL